MPNLAIRDQLRNLRLQNRKLACRGQRYSSTSPDLIHAVERPAAMAWRAVWSCVNSRGDLNMAAVITRHQTDYQSGIRLSGPTRLHQRGTTWLRGRNGYARMERPDLWRYSHHRGVA